MPNAEQRLDQPRAQLDQMIHQRRFAGLDVFVVMSFGVLEHVAGGASLGAAAGLRA